MAASQLSSLLLPAVLISAWLLVVSASEDPRVTELLLLQRRSPDRVIRINDQLFEKFGQGDPLRPYSLVIFFDAKDLHSKHPDLHLKDLRKEFGLTATTYVETHAGTPEATKIFFCDIEFKQSERTFRGFRVETLPHIRMLPEGKAKSVGMEAGKFAFSAEGVAQFVTAKTSIPIGNIQRPPPVTKAQMAVMGAFILATLPFAVRYMLTRKTIVHDPRLWCFMALVVYFFSVSGGMYNIIRSMPMYTTDRNNPKKFTYWYGSSGAQFGVEGFSIGGLYTIVGVMLAMVTYLVPLIANKQLQRLFVVVCLAVGYQAVREVALIDNWKTGYNIHAFFPSSWS